MQYDAKLFKSDYHSSRCQEGELLAFQDIHNTLLDLDKSLILGCSRL